MSDLQFHVDTVVGHLLEAFGEVAGIVDHIDSSDQEARVKSLCADLDSALRNARAMRPTQPEFRPRDPESLHPYGAGNGPLEQWGAA